MAIDLQQSPLQILENVMEMSQVICKDSKTDLIIFLLSDSWNKLVSDILKDKQFHYKIRIEIKQKLRLLGKKTTDKFF